MTNPFRSLCTAQISARPLLSHVVGWNPNPLLFLIKLQPVIRVKRSGLSKCLLGDGVSE